MTAERIKELQTPKEVLEYIKKCDKRIYSFSLDEDAGIGLAICTQPENGLYELLAFNKNAIYNEMVESNFARSFNNRLRRPGQYPLISLVEDLLYPGIDE